MTYGSMVTAPISNLMGATDWKYFRMCTRLRLSFPPLRATRILSPSLIMLKSRIAAPTYDWIAKGIFKSRSFVFLGGSTSTILSININS